MVHYKWTTVYPVKLAKLTYLIFVDSATVTGKTTEHVSTRWQHMATKTN